MIRYVGKSCQGLRRPRAHRNPSKRAAATHCARWIRELASHALTYEIVVLDTTDDKLTLPSIEIWWIAYGRGSGWPLTNLTTGGEGTHGHIKSPETCAKISLSKKNPSERTRQLLSEATSRQMADPANRHQISVANTGRVKTPQHRANIGEGRKGKGLGVPRSAEVRRKLSLAHTGKVLSAEHKESLRQAKLGRPWSVAQRAARAANVAKGK